MGLQVTYTASSLDDIAELFDQRQAEALRAAESARKASDRDEAGVEARIWQRAADIVRATTLTVHATAIGTDRHLCPLHVEQQEPKGSDGLPVSAKRLWGDEPIDDQSW